MDTAQTPDVIPSLVHVSTDSVPPDQRTAYWADWVCSELIRAEVQTLTPSPGFQGSIARVALPGVEVCRIQSTQQEVARTPSMAANTEHEQILVTVQRRGVGLITQDGRTARLQPGEMAMFSTARPYTLRFDAGFEQTLLILPAAQVHHLLGAVDTLYATTLAPTAGPQDVLQRLADTLTQGPQATPERPVHRHLGQALLHTLAAAVESCRPNDTITPAGRGPLGTYHRARIHTVINRHLADPRLDIDLIAAKVQLSPAHIHRLFEAEPATVAATIRLRRLQACQRDLADPNLAHRAISDIAYSWGFNQAAHFSRLFKQTFGMSPGTWRALQRH